MDESTKWTIHLRAGCCKNGRIRGKHRWALHGMSLVIYYHLIRMWHNSMSGCWLQLSDQATPHVSSSRNWRTVLFKIYTFSWQLHIYILTSFSQLSRCQTTAGCKVRFVFWLSKVCKCTSYRRRAGSAQLWLIRSDSTVPAWTTPGQSLYLLQGWAL